MLLFSNQERYVGFVAEAVPELGDITFFAGFVIAFAGYFVLSRNKIRRDYQSA